MPIPNPPPTGQGQQIVIPQTTLVEGQPSIAKLQAVQVNATEAKLIQWPFKDDNGNPVDLTDVLDQGFTIQVRFREAIHYALGQWPPTVVIAGTCPTPSTGVINIQLTQEVVQWPGIYWMEIALINPAFPDVSAFSTKGYLAVNRSLWTPTPGGCPVGFPSGPPSIPEIRLAMRDSTPSDNLWLGVTEFDLAEIAAAIEYPIHYWNEAPPPIRLKYSTTSFPSRYHWLGAICSRLYLFAEHWYTRVHLPYQAGGLAIDDKNKFREYGAKGEKMWSDYQKWVQWDKVAKNAAGAVMSMGSQYFGWSWTA